MSRLLYSFPINSNRNYLLEQNRESFRVSEICKSTLVTSLCDDGLHRPAIDVDVPACVTRLDSRLVLWVDMRTTRRRFRRLLETFSTLGLSPAVSLKLSKRSRVEMFRRASEKTLNFAPPWSTCISLSGEFLGSFDELLNAGKELSEGVTFTSPKSMENPWPIPLVDATEIFLAPSSTEGHSHLYMEKPLEWLPYVEMLEVMVACSIVEPGYLGASMARSATNLRRPGYFKGAPDNDELSMLF